MWSIGRINDPQRMARRLLSVVAALGMVSCGTKSSTQGSAQGLQSLYADNPYNLRLSLTDAPNDQIKSVFVNVMYAELRLSGGGKEGRVIVAKDLGLVDLLKLQNGVTLPMADLKIPEAVTVTQIRLVLSSENNYIIKSDESRCDLQTPSQQKTGLKLLIHKGITVEQGYSYSIVADFDAMKSVVLQGNSGCLLKPVIKLKSATRIENPPDDGDETGDDTTGDDTTGDDTTGDTGTGTGDSTTSPDVPPSGDDIIATEDDATQAGDETGFDDGEDTSVPTVDPGDLDLYF